MKDPHRSPWPTWRASALVSLRDDRLRRRHVRDLHCRVHRHAALAHHAVQQHREVRGEAPDGGKVFTPPTSCSADYGALRHTRSPDRLPDSAHFVTTSY